jgi:hypothetical protein
MVAGATAPEHPRVKEILQSALNDTRASVRRYAFIALKDHPAPWVVEKIEKLSKDDPEASIRQTADQILKRWSETVKGS